MKASPACKRAVVETVEALRNEGHECVEFETTLGKCLLILVETVELLIKRL